MRRALRRRLDVYKRQAELFAYSYEKIWEEMTEMDRFLAGLLTEKEEYKREEEMCIRDRGNRCKDYCGS